MLILFTVPFSIHQKKANKQNKVPQLITSAIVPGWHCDSADVLLCSILCKEKMCGTFPKSSQETVMKMGISHLSTLPFVFLGNIST